MDESARTPPRSLHVVIAMALLAVLVGSPLRLFGVEGSYTGLIPLAAALGVGAAVGRWWACAVSAAIPFVVARVANELWEYGDPPGT